MPVATIGANLKRLRGQTTQEELAAKAGLKQADVSKWETDRAMPSVPNLIRLAQALNLSVNALLAGLSPAYDDILARESRAAHPSLADIPPPSLDDDDGEEVDPAHPSERLARIANTILEVGADLGAWITPPVARRGGPDVPSRNRKGHARTRQKPHRGPAPKRR